MKKTLFALTALIAAQISITKAEINDWGYLGQFPYVYLAEEATWAYVFTYDGLYYAYVFDTDSFIEVGATEEGYAPQSLAGRTITFQYQSSGVFGEPPTQFASVNTYNADGTYSSVAEIDGDTITTTGTYVYTILGPDVAYIVSTADGEGFTFREVLQFSSETSIFYFALALEGASPSLVGDDASYGTAVLSPEE